MTKYVFYLGNLGIAALLKIKRTLELRLHYAEVFGNNTHYVYWYHGTVGLGQIPIDVK